MTGQTPDLGSAQSKRLILVVGTLVIIAWVVWTTRSALFPFLIGAIIAYVLLPQVEFIEARLKLRGRWAGLARPLAIVSTYLTWTVILALAGLYLIPPIFHETVKFIEQLPQYWRDVQDELYQFIAWYEQNVPESVRREIEANLGILMTAVSNALSPALAVTVAAVGTIIGVLAGMVLLPLWLFYVLKDRDRGMEWFYRLWPEPWRADVLAIVGIVDRVLGTYIRVQLLLGVIIGVITGVTLWLIGVPQPLVLGVIAGFLELIPILGPWLAFLIAALVTLATVPDRILLVALAFLAIQQLENSFLVPKLQGQAVHINPAIIMILLVIGAALWGVLGMLVIIPLTAVLRDIFVYLYQRTGDSPSQVARESPADVETPVRVPGDGE